jgi:hypothetical protein
MGRMSHRGGTAAGFILISALVMMGAGCSGGSNSSKAGGSAPTVPAHTATTVRGDAAEGPAKNDGSTSAPQNPCTLVTRAEAQAIIGASIDAPRVQPLGPTCIYQTAHSSTFITMAVERVNFDQVKPQIQDIVPVSGLGHQAYCGNYGRPTIFVVLDSTRILNVAAPCNVAKQFAAKAMPRVRF